MANRLLAIVFIGLVSGTLASSNSHLDSTQKNQNVSLSLERVAQVLYIGIDNPFILNLCDLSHDKVIVSIDNGGIVEQNDGHYIARVIQKGQATITVTQKGGSRKEIGKFPFRVLPLPNPVVKLGSFSPGAIPLSSFKVQRLIMAQLEGFGFDLPITIKGFEYVHVSVGQPVIIHKVQGAAFSADVKEDMNTAKAGDYIIIDAVKIDVPEGRTLPAVVYQLI